MSEPNYRTAKFFAEHLLATRMRRIQILINKPVYLGLSILDLKETVIYEFWYDYVKPKHGKNAKLFYMVTDSTIVHVNADYIYKDIAENVKTRFESSNDELERPYPQGKIKKRLD